MLKILSMKRYSQTQVIMGHLIQNIQSSTVLCKGGASITHFSNENGTKAERPKGGHNYLKWAGLRPEGMPNHVNVILDGTRRWCEKKGIGLTYEHFYSKAIMLAELCIKLGIPTFSWFVFASCTWKRSKEDTDLMLRQLQESLEDNREKFTREGIKVSIIGQKWRFPECLQEEVKRVEEATKEGKKLHMIYLVSYGGRWDIVEAARSITQKVISGQIDPKDVDEALVEEQLSANKVSHKPDLLIRCGGKRRFSNICLWQLANAKLFFSGLFHPDFEQPDFLNAVRWFQVTDK